MNHHQRSLQRCKPNRDWAIPGANCHTTVLHRLPCLWISFLQDIRIKPLQKVKVNQKKIKAKRYSKYGICKGNIWYITTEWYRTDIVQDANQKTREREKKVYWLTWSFVHICILSTHISTNDQCIMLHNKHEREWDKIVHTTHVIGLRWPTKSLSVFHPSLSTICAVGPPLFIACAETRYWPSGDQLGRRTVVVPPH